MKQSKADRARSRFHLRAGQAGRAAKRYDECSRPLFPFWMIMQCEGLLAAEPSGLSDSCPSIDIQTELG